MIVSVQMRKVSGSFLMSFKYLRRRRSAESWIGVSGFLISCAMRRAMSAQAALRCADNSSVISSKVTTKPLNLALGTAARPSGRFLEQAGHFRRHLREILAD